MAIERPQCLRQEQGIRNVSCAGCARSPRSSFSIERCAFGGDYSVTYAIDENGKTSGEKIETCGYETLCFIEPPGLGLQISLSFNHSDRRWVELHIDGPPACCYSSDATRELNLQITPGLVRVPIYQGRARRRNEFVQNHKFGVVYLEFSNLR